MACRDVGARVSQHCGLLDTRLVGDTAMSGGSLRAVPYGTVPYRIGRSKIVYDLTGFHKTENFRFEIKIILYCS